MKKVDKGLLKKGDVGILLLALAIAGIMYLYAGHRAEGENVYITAKGKTTVYPLGENTAISLYDGTDSYNTIVIKNSTVFMKNASCPDQICVHHKAVSKDGETIICLPNQVFIEVESNRKGNTDN